MTDGWLQTTHEMDRCWCKCGDDQHAYRGRGAGAISDSEGEALLSIICRSCHRQLRAAARAAMTMLEEHATQSDAERVAQHLEQTLGAFGIFRADVEPQ